MSGMKAKSTNTFGIRYLSKGRPGKGLYAVKFEYGCINGKHGKYEYLYEGNDFNLAKKLALKTQELMQIGGATKLSILVPTSISSELYFLSLFFILLQNSR